MTSHGRFVREFPDIGVTHGSLISTLSKSNIHQLGISFSGMRQDQLMKLLSVKALKQIWCTNCTHLNAKQLQEFRKRFEAKYHKPLQLMKSAI